MTINFPSRIHLGRANRSCRIEVVILSLLASALLTIAVVLPQLTYLGTVCSERENKERDRQTDRQYELGSSRPTSDPRVRRALLTTIISLASYLSRLFLLFQSRYSCQQAFNRECQAPFRPRFRTITSCPSYPSHQMMNHVSLQPPSTLTTLRPSPPVVSTSALLATVTGPADTRPGTTSAGHIQPSSDPSNLLS